MVVDCLWIQKLVFYTNLLGSFNLKYQSDYSSLSQRVKGEGKERGQEHAYLNENELFGDRLW